MKASPIHRELTLAQARARVANGIQIGQDSAIIQDAYRGLASIGIHVPASYIADACRLLADSIATGTGMDDIGGLTPLQAPVTSPSIPTPIQFLQTFLPGLVRVLTAARKIDELVGIQTVGSWEDEEIVQGIVEPLGYAQPYHDYTNIPLSSWNLNFERRSVVRMEMGMQVGTLEEARAGRVRVAAAAEKRQAAALALEIVRNRVGFVGYNGGANRTYGFLNDPQLPAYIAVAAGAGGGTEWSGKTYLEIVADLTQAFAQLQAQSGDLIDPSNVPTTLAIPHTRLQFLGTPSEFGNSVRDWLTKTYPRCTVVTAPELVNANGAASVMYLYPETMADSGTDDGRVFSQLVPSKFMALGVEKKSKSYIEDYTNALAGVILKRPYGVARFTGI